MSMQNNVALDWETLKPAVMRIHQNTVEEMNEIKSAVEKVSGVKMSGGVVDSTLEAIETKLSETAEILKQMPEDVEALAKTLEAKSNELEDAISGGVSMLSNLEV